MFIGLASVTHSCFLTVFVCFFKFRLSGFQLPSSIVSTGSILTLWFTTDFAVSAQGFRALYEGRPSAVLRTRPLCGPWPAARLATGLD